MTQSKFWNLASFFSELENGFGANLARDGRQESFLICLINSRSAPAILIKISLIENSLRFHFHFLVTSALSIPFECRFTLIWFNSTRRVYKNHTPQLNWLSERQLSCAPNYFVAFKCDIISHSLCFSADSAREFALSRLNVVRLSLIDLIGTGLKAANDAEKWNSCVKDGTTNRSLSVEMLHCWSFAS